ncbi:MAG: cation:proton antiporter, partial [Thermomicrobiales bacterium]|nr:cation:proton antiporter [Thermomicrobiales bacterium]
DRQTWRMIEFVLEGAVFLIMGLELDWVLEEVQQDHVGIARAAQFAVLALVLTMAIRAMYVVPLIYLFRAGADRANNVGDMLQQLTVEPIANHPINRKLRGRSEANDATTMARFQKSWRRRLADIDYFRNEQMGWREGTVIVWAGMRGAVTLAAAQTLPRETPSRSLLVFIAFLVAAASLLIQGSTLPWLVRKVLPPTNDLARTSADRVRLSMSLHAAASAILKAHGLDPEAPFPHLASGPMPLLDAASTERQILDKQVQLEMIEAQRTVLLDAMADGTYSSELISTAMANLDADQIALEMKGEPAHGH